MNEYLATMDNSETIFLATFLVKFIVSNSGSSSSSILASSTGKLSGLCHLTKPKLTFFHSLFISLMGTGESKRLSNTLICCIINLLFAISIFLTNNGDKTKS